MKEERGGREILPPLGVGGGGEPAVPGHSIPSGGGLVTTWDPQSSWGCSFLGRVTG